ncbi:MAG: FKBP-type peptidyl-prolyl cis-trans isomerase [Salinivirgaceae bacterium]|nr:FKBP-type peptidyl-prolyl cis-trans isomerase [Salinivirgaceae bacterium]MDD4746236.1 FKBP-type peptidyl-prolyl cis-trans isomerase [Salinivirgaceae bacterium]MDY0281734.1 FKBP-type peptidyl-prolyl cis-trans isomerase [Salinivirgaceae bacterium]
MRSKHIFLIIAVVSIISIILSCNNQRNNNKNSLTKKEVGEILIDANKLQIADDTQRVVSYIRLNDWKMQRTKTGIWYEIIESNNGPKIKNGDVVALSYRIHLLNGKECYSSDKTGPKVFKVSKGGVESGLEEGILLLKGGDSARFIIPQFQAHHLLGDGDEIPPLSTIIYTLRVIEVASKNESTKQ